MITLTRSQVRRLRSVFRRSALGITHRGIIPALVLRADGGQLRAQYRYRDLAVEYVEPGNHRPAATVAIPLDALADFEGAGRHAGRPRVRRPGPHRRPLGGPRHPAEPRVRPRHPRRPHRRDARRCRRPGHRTRPELLGGPGRGDRDGHARLDPLRPRVHPAPGLAAARSSPPTAGSSWSAPASASPGPSDVLIKGSPALRLPGPAARPAGRGRPDRHARRLPRSAPGRSPARSRRTSGSRRSSGSSRSPARSRPGCGWTAEDAGFLESALGRLPGGGEINAPVTIEASTARWPCVRPRRTSPIRSPSWC